MGIYSELDIEIQELEQGIELMRLENTTEELQTLDFDHQNHTDDVDWWKQQDAELEQQELEQIKGQADIEDMRLNGYS